VAGTSNSFGRFPDRGRVLRPFFVTISEAPEKVISAELR
jgi:hypothetical protein